MGARAAALEAQRLLDLIALKAMPALAAGVIAYLHMASAGYAVVLAVAMLGALQLGNARRSRST